SGSRASFAARSRRRRCATPSKSSGSPPRPAPPVADADGSGGRAPRMLRPYRVLDLTTERGLLCGQILGDLGADVVQIEQPGGSPARRLGPFVDDVPHPDRSLFWWAQTRNKRSVTLALDEPAGRD